MFNSVAGKIPATFYSVIKRFYCENDMNNRLKTDFLCPSTSFLTGFGSVLNLHGHLYEYNCSADPDTIAIRNDWRMVGQEISDSLKRAKTEFGCPSRK